MRQLSKVIFINSAGIRYGEVRLDGNGCCGRFCSFTPATRRALG